MPAVETFTCPLKVAVDPLIAVPDWLVKLPGLTGVYPNADTICPEFNVVTVLELPVIEIVQVPVAPAPTLVGA